MAEDITQEVLRTLTERQTEIEKIQATQNQILSNLTTTTEELVEQQKEDRHYWSEQRKEDRDYFSKRFDTIDERQRFPVKTLLSFLGIMVTLAGLSFAGFAYYIKLSYLPAEQRIAANTAAISDVRTEADRRFGDDDRREIVDLRARGEDKAEISSLRAHVNQQEALNHHLHVTKRQQIERLERMIEEHVKLPGHPTAIERHVDLEKQIAAIIADLGNIRSEYDVDLQRAIEQIQKQLETKMVAERSVQLSRIHQEILGALKGLHGTFILPKEVKE